MRQKKQKIYLETTLFNYYFDEDRDAHADTVTLFEECVSGKFEPYTSGYIISLNFRHIVRDRTIEMTGAINKLLGYPIIKIKSPMEVIDDEKTRYHLGRGSQDSS